MYRLPRQRKMVVFGGVLLGLLFSALDQTVVGTAMPRVIASLGGLALYSWVTTAYLLTSTTMLPIFGKLSDIYGRRLVYAGGLVVFMIGSMLSGASQTMEQLIVFRALQGIGAAAMQPIAFAIVGDLFAPAERGKYQGVTAGVYGITSIIGPTLGGFITDTWGWRWVFYVNIPVGLITLAVILMALPGYTPGLRRSIDYLGVTFLILTMVPFLLALVWGGQTYPWFSPEVVGLFATAAVGLFLFIWAEHHAIEPILPLDLFRNRIFAVSAVAVFLQGVGMFGSILFAPLFIQGVIGSSATNSGLVLTPMSLAMIIASIISGQLLSRWGRYRIIAVVSMVIMAVGMYLMSQMTVTTTESEAVRNMVIVGVGLGGGMALYAVVVQNAFPYARLGVVTSGIQFFRSIGGTVGVAVMGSIMATRLTQYLTTSLPPQMRAMIPADQLTSATGAQALLNPEAMARAGNRLASLGPAGQLLLGQVQIALKGALAAALHDVFLTGFAVVLAATAVVFFLEEIPLRKTHGETPVLKQHHPAPEPKTGGG